MEKIISRLQQYIDYKKISFNAFDKSIDASNGYIGRQIKNQASIGGDVLEKISCTYLDLDIRWLITGKGDMLYKEEKNVRCNNVEILSDFTSQYDKKQKIQHVPLYRLDPVAGLAALYMDDRLQKPVGHIDIPNLPKCDGATYIVGDSMYPLLKSGDIILFKKISNNRISDIIYGEMYMLDIEMDGDTYITVKYVHRSDTPDHIKLVSQNQHHDPVDIATSRIRSMAIVKASIRFNTLR